MRDDYVFELLVNLHDLKVHLLSDVDVKISNGLYIHLRSWQKCLDSKHVNNQAAFRSALDVSLDDEILFFGLVDFVPSTEYTCRPVGDNELSVFVLLSLNEDRHNIPFL